MAIAPGPAGPQRVLRCACVDIGTNTTRLLVADRTPDGLRTVVVARAFVPLGTAALAPPTVAATTAALCAAVRGHLDIARRHDVDVVRVVGTAALRSADDPDALCAAIRAAAATDVEILTPREEARLAFRGATGTLLSPQALPGEVAVVDVGGGSTEVAVGEPPGTVRWWRSVPVGSAALTAEHVHTDPPTCGEIDALREAATQALRFPDAPQPALVYAVGGSAASLPRMVGAQVTPEAAERAVTLLTAAPAARVAAEHGLDERRVRVLPAGILLLAAAGVALGSAPLVARGGLREGVVLEA